MGNGLNCQIRGGYLLVNESVIVLSTQKEKSKQELSDYKFFCFNGEPRYCQVIADRHTKETIDFFDMEWRHQEFYGLNPKCGNAFQPAAKPAALPQMIAIARRLAKDIPFLRVDLYYINGKVYFGEMTFFPASGMGVFTPEEWDEKLGSWITLSQHNK